MTTNADADSGRAINRRDCDCDDGPRWWKHTLHRPPDGKQPPCPKWRPLPPNGQISRG
jgi:hypothetical protein